LSYLSYLFRLWVLSEDTLFTWRTAERRQNKYAPKSKVTNAPTSAGNGSHCHVCILWWQK